MQELLAAVRRACSPATWSRGVELCRAGAVVGERETADEVELRVATESGIVSPAVVLYPQDRDWSCECTSNEEACVHVAAAVIALRQARQAGKRLPGADRAPGHIAYRFSRTSDGLAIGRCVVQGGEVTELSTTLSAIASGKVEGPRFAATHTDVEIERALATGIRGLVPRTVMPGLLSHLVDHPDVQLDGRSVKVGGPTTGLVARVQACPEGFLLRLEQETGISEVFANGAVRCADDTLRSVQDSGLCRGELEALRRGRIFASDAVHELVADVLPALGQRLTVVVETDALPKLQRGIPPRLVLEVAREQRGISVLATLVYGDPPGCRIDGEKLVHLRGPLPTRDQEEEKRLLRRLERQLGMRPGLRQHVSGEEAVAFAARLRAFCDGPQGATRVRPGATAQAQLCGSALQDFFLAPPLAPRLAVHADDFELSFTSDLGLIADASGGSGGSAGEPEGRGRIGHADAGAVLRAWREGASVVALAGGGFAPLPVDWLARCGDTISDLLAAKAAAGGALPPSSLGDLSRLCVALEQPPPPGLQRLRAVLERCEEVAEPTLPDDLRATLRAYQRQGVAWLRLLRDAGLGAVLADDMGLGKTIQALCAVGGSTLVVAPTSVLHNWAREIERFRPGLRHAVYHGPGRSLDCLARGEEHDNGDAGAESASGVAPLVVLTTYAILRLDIDALAAIAWDTVILDESQNIKNPDSQVARAAYRLRAGFRVTLSGTPVENRLDELWSQLHFTNPGLLGGRTDFQDRYAKPIASGALEAAERLRGRIRPFVLRRLKRQVASELPPRTEVVLRCELSEPERAVYDAIVAATRREVLARLQAGGDVIAALEALLRLRQACCHWALVPGQRHRDQPSPAGMPPSSAKVTLLLETLDKALASGHKALIFSQWTSLLDLVEPHLEHANVRFARLDGSTRDREAVVAGFQDEAAGPPVMLVSLKAGGSGLNLTAADNVFLLDPWWNPAVEDQAADRAHRIGQQRPVIVHRLVAADTVEERILALQEHKRDLADAALAGTGRGVALTRDDLLGLLS